MKPLPDRPDLNQLKKQAKELLAAYRLNSPEAIDRFRAALPESKVSMTHRSCYCGYDCMMHSRVSPRSTDFYPGLTLQIALQRSSRQLQIQPR